MCYDESYRYSLGHIHFSFDSVHRPPQSYLYGMYFIYMLSSQIYEIQLCVFERVFFSFLHIQFICINAIFVVYVFLY